MDRPLPVLPGLPALADLSLQRKLLSLLLGRPQFLKIWLVTDFQLLMYGFTSLHPPSQISFKRL